LPTKCVLPDNKVYPLDARSSGYPQATTGIGGLLHGRPDIPKNPLVDVPPAIRIVGEISVRCVFSYRVEDGEQGQVRRCVGACAIST
jgi:hypothetical protein